MWKIADGKTNLILGNFTSSQNAIKTFKDMKSKQLSVKSIHQQVH